jgi:hypothetical protein
MGMVEHFADSLAANACVANDLPNGDTLSEDLISDAQPLRDVPIHSAVPFQQSIERAQLSVVSQSMRGS